MPTYWTDYKIYNFTASASTLAIRKENIFIDGIVDESHKKAKNVTLQLVHLI